MEGNLADANATHTDVDLCAGNPSTPGENMSGRSVDTINTVDDHPVKDVDTDTAAAAKAAADTNKDDAGKTGAGASTDDDKGGKDGAEDDDRFDKHPRFQELINTVNELKGRNSVLEGILTALQNGNQVQSPHPDGGSTPSYKDVSQMSKDELLEWFEENPADFLNNFANQVIHENTTKEQQQTFNQRVSQTFSDYAKGNADFDAMWKSGKIEEYMNAHPGHNAISAHMALTQEQRLKDAVDKAVKETEQRVVKNFQAKRDAGTMGDAGGGGNRTPDKDSELKDTKSTGGLIASLARRHATRRAGAGG